MEIKVVKNGYNKASTLSIEHLTILGFSPFCGSPAKVFHNGKRLTNIHSEIDFRSKGRVSHKKTNVLTRNTISYSSKEPGLSAIGTFLDATDSLECH